MGPHESRLRDAVATMAHWDVQSSDGAWTASADNLAQATQRLHDAAAAMSKAFGGAQIGAAASSAFLASAQRTDERSQQMYDAAAAIKQANTAMTNAQQTVTAMGAAPSEPKPYVPDPSQSDQDQIKGEHIHSNQVTAYNSAMADRETQSQQALAHMDTTYAASTKVMEKIHGEPDKTPGTITSTQPSGGGSSSLPPGAAGPGGSGPGGTTPGHHVVPIGHVVPTTTHHHPPGTTTEWPPLPPPPTHNPPVVDPPVTHPPTGQPQGPGSGTTPGTGSLPGTTPTGGGSGGGSGSLGNVGGSVAGGVGAAGLGAIGGVGALGSGSGGVGYPTGVSGVPSSGSMGGRPIGGSVRPVGSGSVLGGRGTGGMTGEEESVGSRGTGVRGVGDGAGGSGRGSSGRGTRGSAGGRGRGTGAGAGAGRGKKDKKGRGSVAEIFDTEKDWLDDDGVAPPLLD